MQFLELNEPNYVHDAQIKDIPCINNWLIRRRFQVIQLMLEQIQNEREKEIMRFNRWSDLSWCSDLWSKKEFWYSFAFSSATATAFHYIYLANVIRKFVI